MGKVLYVITTHQRYVQVAELVRLLISTGASVLVHPNPAGEDWEASPLAPAVHSGGARIVYDPVRVTWGNATIFEAVLRSWKQALALPEWEWVITISGQDFPLRRPEEHRDRLLGSKYDAWLDAKRVPFRGGDQRPGFGASNQEILRRHAFTYRFLGGNWARQVPVRAKHTGLLTYRKASDDLLAFGVRTGTARSLDRLFTRGLHFGSSWMDLRREIVEHVVHRTTSDRTVARLSRSTIFPEETILPSLVMEVARHPCLTSNNRFVNWDDPTTGHTTDISMEALPVALASDALLGRKFDLAGYPDVRAVLLENLGVPDDVGALDVGRTDGRR